jgi:hypothetical protein
LQEDPEGSIGVTPPRNLLRGGVGRGIQDEEQGTEITRLLKRERRSRRQVTGITPTASESEWPGSLSSLMTIDKRE